MASEKFTRDVLAMLPGLRAFAMSLCGNRDRADDLVQDTILRAWGAQESFIPDSNMRAWLFTILRNSYFGELRKRRREVEDVEDAYAAKLSMSGEQESHMDMLDFLDHFEMITPSQQEVVMLVGVAGYSYEEAAEIAGVAVGTIKSRLNRAREVLTAKLGFEKGRAVEKGTHPRRALAAPENNIALPKPAPVKRHHAGSEIWKAVGEKANAKKLPLALPPPTPDPRVMALPQHPPMSTPVSVHEEPAPELPRRTVVDLEAFGIGFMLHQTV